MDKIIFYLLFALAFLVAVFVLIYNTNYLGTSDVMADLYVTEGRGIGFNIDTDALHYGHIGQGLSGTRRLNITNKYGYMVKIKIITEMNEMEKWMTLEKRFDVNGNETKLVPVRISVPKNADPGYYTNKILVKYYKK